MIAAVPVLQAEGLVKTFPDTRAESNARMVAIDGVSLAIAEGEFLAIVGPSGGGKTTLLRLLGGLAVPDEGFVRFRGEPLVEPRREIGFVFQRANLMPWRTVLHNIALPLEVSHAGVDEARTRASALVDLVGLKGFDDAYPRQLSGGMQQRVALARALIHEPQALLLDEPFGALDALTRERMNGELMRIWSLRRPAVIMVTHSINEAVFLADRVLVMSARPGRVRAEFPIDLARPRDFPITMTPEFGNLARAVRAEIVE
jgi:NitT/TauT family transport system ATP-binding protein